MSVRASAARTDLPIAWAIVDLSPRSPVPMGGRCGEERLTRRVEGRLEANVVAFGEGAEAVVLVSLDTLFAGEILTSAIVKACMKRFGVGPERVLVLASHTHSAPMLDPSKPRLGRADLSETHRWANGVAAAILTAETAQVGHVRTGSGRSDLSVNRRRRWRLPTLVRLLGKMRGDVYMCDNPAGPRDPTIRTCVWLSPEGKPLAAFWSFACHPVAFPDAEVASADYVGVVREELRRTLGANLPVIFGPGCMGDVRPRAPRSWAAPDRLLHLLVYGPSPRPFDRGAWGQWAADLAAETVAIDAASLVRPVESAPEASEMASLPMSALFDGDCPTAELCAKAVRVPGLERIVTLSCEPVTDVASMLTEGSGDLVLGYEGDVFGYLPTDEMIAEGGYEPSESLSHFGLVGTFRPGLNHRITALGRALKGRGFATAGS